MKVRKVFYISGFLTAVLIAVLWSTGVFGLWTDGMAYLANNTKDFTDKRGHLVEGEYSMAVDLSNLDSNIEKEIFNDGDHRIYITWLQRTINGGYEIGLGLVDNILYQKLH